MDLKEHLVKAFAESAQSEIRLVDNPPAHGERLAGEAHIVQINLKGGITGRCILAMNPEPARVIASRVLSMATASDFPAGDVDDELASNTVGELINIALGEYFSARKDKPAAAELSSPRYARFRDADPGSPEMSRMTFICDGELFDIFHDIS